MNIFDNKNNFIAGDENDIPSFYEGLKQEKREKALSEINAPLSDSVKILLGFIAAVLGYFWILSIITK